MKLLTNWRPITLCNCDHKIFTKLYANRICDKISASIGENQTAYLKGRLINDNIRSLLANIKIVNNEDDLSAAIISLDAKKAFDSIEHSYIEKCLGKFGLGSFVPIFKMLYSELRSDILINGEIARGYSIKRGVKQGDALSCVLFIMCMEPLIKNIEKNQEIEPIFSSGLNSNLPKIYAYADDVNCITRDKPSCIQKFFEEYERLTKLSGLTLNADKTEILKIKSTNLRLFNTLPYRVNYLGETHQLKNNPEIKVNGILMCQDENDTRKNNVEATLRKIDNQLKRWSRRSLSILGKVLVVKTFGISQIIYLMQSMCLKPDDFKLFNSLLYKFIWNKNYQAAKAPERIKREIMNKPIKLGGLGMLDIVELDNSLKLKALGRLDSTNHPMLKLLKRTLNMNNFFYPKASGVSEEVMSKGIKILSEDRKLMWASQGLYSNRLFLKAVKEIKILDALSINGRQSLLYFNVRIRGKTRLSELTTQELRSLTPFLPASLVAVMTDTRNSDPGNLAFGSEFLYSNGKMLVPLNKLTSKAIRDIRTEKEPICLYKFGPVVTPNEALSWAYNVSRLTSTKHRDLVLRLAHGELYYRERLFRFNLVDNPFCQRCGEVESLEHKYVTCEYIAAIWRLVTNLTIPGNRTLDDKERILCVKETNVTSLTVHAELLVRIRQLKSDLNYLVHPKIIFKKALEHLIRREKKEEIKRELNDLLQDV